MKVAKALICTENQNISLAEVTLPDLRPKDILVKNLYSGVSIGTELLLVRNQASWGPFPIWLGYQAVGIAEQIGSAVGQFKKGDKVYHRGSSVPAFLDNQQVSPTSGAHGTHSIVDTTSQTHSAALAPDNLDDAAGSLFVMLSVGLHGVDKSGVKTGDTVVVFGTGLIGLANVVAAKQRGAVVVAIDLKPIRLQAAKRFGADYIIEAEKEDIQKRLAQIAPHGPDVVFESSGNPVCIDKALSLCKQHGKFVFQGDYGECPLTFTWMTAHEKQLTAYFPSEDGYQPCRETVMGWIARQNVKWDQAITHRLSPQEAPDFYHAINQGNVDNLLGVVIKWC